MKVNREQFLKTLNGASIGLSKKEILEQSNSFVFYEGKIITFNDEIFCSSDSPLEFDAVIVADDLMKILSRLPDEEIDIDLKGEEMIIKGKRRTAGITCASTVHLPFEAVPSPDKWTKLVPGFGKMLQQASRTCGSDETQYKTTCVHVTPDLIQACDNFRFLRVDMETGLDQEILIPASSIGTLNGITLKRASIGEGWIHFKSDAKQLISVRCSHEKYHTGIDELLEVQGEEITLPKNLAEMIGRAEVMNKSGYDARISITIEEGKLKILARKDGGWFREEKRIKYEGDSLVFDVHPQFLAEVLERTHKVLVGQNKLKLVSEGIQFVVGLEVQGEEEAPF